MLILARRFFTVLLLLVVGVEPTAAEPPTPKAAIAALGRATEYLTSIATEGGFVWRYSEDLGQRFGENPAGTSEIWVQSPGTLHVGMAFLAAYAATRDQLHLEAAHAAAIALVKGQLASGGWDYSIEFDPEERTRQAYRADGIDAIAAAELSNTTTYDDDNTQGSLRFLMSFLEVATDSPIDDLESIHDAVAFGLDSMLDAQYANGAWPKEYEGRKPELGEHRPRPARYPTDWPRTWPEARYEDFYTLNDDTLRDCIRTMLQAWHMFNDDRYLEAAVRGGEFLILAQLPDPQPAWAQQYNFAMEPAWAREFEPPAVASLESAGVMRALVDLYVETGEERFLGPIPAFLRWLDRSRIATDEWARFYELGTNRPIYGDNDGRIHYSLEDVSQERQLGYAWKIDFGIRAAVRRYEAVLANGREVTLDGDVMPDRNPPSDDDVASILAEQDAAGRWQLDGWIDMNGTAAKIHALSDYLLNNQSLPQP